VPILLPLQNTTMEGVFAMGVYAECEGFVTPRLGVIHMVSYVSRLRKWRNRDLWGKTRTKASIMGKSVPRVLVLRNIRI
jgi:hypothetical protein